MTTKQYGLPAGSGTEQLLLFSGTIGGNTGDWEPVTNVGPDGAAQSVFPAGFARTSDEPHSIFYDPFDGVLDTVNLWNAPVAAGGGVTAANASGSVTLGSGTTASSYSSLESQAKLVPTVPGWLGVSSLSRLPNTANAYAFIGAGTQPGTPSTTAPLTDAYGFEVDAATSHLWAVIYAAGVRTAVADLGAAGTGKNDGGWHRFIVYYRTDRTFWYIDTLDTYVASASFVTPSVQTLPAKLLTIAGATPPLSSAVIQSSGYAAWDTGKNSSSIKDGRYGWRTLGIDAAGKIGINGLPNLVGTYGYDAGTAKTVNVPSGARVLSIAVHATTAGTVTIGGGASIPVPGMNGFSSTPGGSLLGPVAIVASGTDSVFVDWVL